jgi:hypothetical protein
LKRGVFVYRTLDAQGKKLCIEEKAKRDKDSFSIWDEMGPMRRLASIPKGPTHGWPKPSNARPA